jgi:alkylation response protein AidB-like acyl-CoA dehydrogenase
MNGHSFFDQQEIFMSATGFNADMRDIHFVLFEQLKIQDRLGGFEALADWDEDMYKSVLESALDLCHEALWPCNATGDAEGCTLDGDGNVTVPRSFEPAWKAMCEGGWVGMASPHEYGGVGLPMPMGAACGEILTGANPSLALYAGLTRGVANLLLEFGSDWMKEMFLEKLFTGTWGGTMCLTESGAGTDVGNNLCKATPTNEDGIYLLKGEKMFISCGDHQLCENILHLVLARVPGAPDGSKGLSIFLVPKIHWTDGSRNDAKVVGIEHKMGINASATTTLALGAEGECKGWIVGKEGKGMHIMFHLMNEARIAVGVQGLGSASAAYLNALAYTKERVQGGAGSKAVPIVVHPDVRRMLMDMRTSTEAMRSMLYTLALRADLSQRLKESDPTASQLHHNHVDLLTPVAKAHSSDVGFEVTVTALQCFGGYGFIREYPAEQHVRDVKIASIYEGTNGIQAIDLLGRKLRHENGLLLMQWFDESNKRFEEAKAVGGFEAQIQSLEKARDSMGACAMHLGQIGMAGNIKAALLHATPFLQLMGHLVLGMHSLEQAVVAQQKLNEGGHSDSDTRFYKGKVLNLSFYVNNTLPKAFALSKVIRSGDESALDSVLFA